jgi:UDP-N-acetylglucosamine 2-epimerase (non-hydrolysing)
VTRRKILFVFGTRPEAIKLAPVIGEFRRRGTVDVTVCVTAQHRDMLDQVLKVFALVPDYDLNTMAPGQSLPRSTGRILTDLEPVLIESKPDVLFVQGDTTTTFAAGLAGFYANIPVAHIEAGLRTYDLRQPFPEELNRVLVSKLATFHFAATDRARDNLHKEGIRPEHIHVTGNTGVDAVLAVRDRLAAGVVKGGDWPFLDPAKKLLLVTAHRRESFGTGFEQLCLALSRIAALPNVQIVYPVHLNPNVSGPVRKYLGSHANIFLLEPLDYLGFVDLMSRAHLILTDSGGIQEEAPSFGKPVLVLRDKTERPEAVEAGTSTLVGMNAEKIVEATQLLLGDEAEYRRRSRIHNPYGDGHASERIATVILEALRQEQR